MVTVRFFGITRLKLKIDKVEVDARNIMELIENISSQYECVSLQDLKNCIIFVNGTNMVKLKLYKTELHDGDDVQIFSPAVGG